MFDGNFIERYKILEVHNDLGVVVPESHPLASRPRQNRRQKIFHLGLLVCAGV